MKVPENELELSKLHLQNLLNRAQEEISVANLKRYKGEIQNLLDAELTRLANLMQKGTGEKPTVKETESINLSSYYKKSYIETREDIDEFISLLKNKLDEIIKGGKRIRIK